MWGGLVELMNNKELYYRSSVGAEYSNWTERGTRVVMEFMISMTKQIQAAEEHELNRRAKDLVIKGLKGETV